MQLGSLVQPIYGFQNNSFHAASHGDELKFIPFTPDKNTVCTVIDAFMGDSGKECIILREVTAYLNGKKVGFIKEYWEEIAPPANADELALLQSMYKC